MSTDEAEEHPYHGKQMGGATASIASGIRPGVLRYFLYDYNARFVLLFSLAVVLVAALLIWGGIVLAGQGGWLSRVAGYGIALVAVPIGIFGLIFLAMVPISFAKDSELFENGLLSAGMVLGRDPLVVLVMTSMGNGSGVDYYGVGRMDLDRLPYHNKEKWTRVPCVCGFVRGDAPDRWSSFECKPICHATGRAADIDRCFHRLGDEPFLRLQAYMERGKLPENENQIILLDGQMNYLETIDKKALAKANAPEVGDVPSPDDRA